ncbi:MAG TPA: hypothetical protein VF474_11505 [Phenylobacterium sp.]
MLFSSGSGLVDAVYAIVVEYMFGGWLVTILGIMLAAVLRGVPGRRAVANKLLLYNFSPLGYLVLLYFLGLALVLFGLSRFVGSYAVFIVAKIMFWLLVATPPAIALALIVRRPAAAAEGRDDAHS